MQTVKSMTAREILAACPEVKKKLWGGEFWSDGYYLSTVGQHGNEEVIKHYIQNQGAATNYQTLYQARRGNKEQLTLF